MVIFTKCVSMNLWLSLISLKLPSVLVNSLAIQVCVHVFVNGEYGVSVCICMCMCISVYVTMCMSESVCGCVCGCVCVYGNCRCVYGYVCVCSQCDLCFYINILFNRCVWRLCWCMSARGTHYWYNWMQWWCRNTRPVWNQHYFGRILCILSNGSTFILW